MRPTDRTLIGLADATLYGPPRTAAVPSTAAAIVVVVTMVALADVNVER